MNAVTAALRLAGAVGIEIRRSLPVGVRRAALLEEHGIGVVVDVGAHVGDYGDELRRFGYRGAIVSFEPGAEAYERLASRSGRDPRWTAYRLALGDAESRQEMCVATNLASSSILPMLPRHRVVYPEITVVGLESVSVTTLDAFGIEMEGPAFVKLDVQGYEDRVLAGAEETLKAVSLIECELCIQPLYESQRPLHEMLDLFRDLGFGLVTLEPGPRNASGVMAYCDGIFARSGSP